MKTTLRAAALAAIVLEAFVLSRPAPPLLLRSPGDTGQEGKSAGASTIRGRVVRGAEPVPGAAVTLVLPRARVSAPVLRRTVSDAAGQFTFTGVPAGACRVAAAAPGLAPASIAVEVPVDPSGVDIAIELDAGAWLEGRVQSGGSPVAGARLTVWISGEAASWQPGGRPLREGVTDEDGRFRLEGIPSCGRVRILTRAAGFRPHEISTELAKGNPLSIELIPAPAASGMVTTSTGLPVGDAEISGSQGEGYPAEARTGPEGAFRLEGLADRPVTIWIRKEGFAPGRVDLPRPGHAIAVVLLREGGLAGRVEPSIGAAFIVVTSGGATYRRPLGSDGTFRWAELPPGEARVGASDRAGRLLVERKFVIPEGETIEGIVLSP